MDTFQKVFSEFVVITLSEKDPLPLVPASGHMIEGPPRIQCAKAEPRYSSESDYRAASYQSKMSHIKA
jgi:hypothetical protein